MVKLSILLGLSLVCFSFTSRLSNFIDKENIEEWVENRIKKVNDEPKEGIIDEGEAEKWIKDHQDFAFYESVVDEPKEVIIDEGEVEDWFIEQLSKNQ